jgi:DNA polymerase
MKSRTEQLKGIRDEIWKLKESPLYKFRIKNKYYPVVGEGNHSAEIMFVGEAPGKNEAETGKPFCGTAGKILDKLLKVADLKRKDVYITNVVKDRPPENRDPETKEIELYSPFLIRQINIIKPKIIVSLGRFSMDFLMRYFNLEEKIKPISLIHGKVFEAQASYGKIKIIPIFHPAFVIYNPNKLPLLKKDFKTLKRLKETNL